MKIESSYRMLSGPNYKAKAKASGKKNLTTFLLTDGMKVFAVAFNSKSVLEMRSELLADDEDDIVQLGDDLPFYQVRISNIK